jgi:hypothetical protein
MAWAEDRATVGTDPSADPGAKTEGWAAASLCRPPFPDPLRDWHECDKSIRARTLRVVNWLPLARWPKFPEKRRL